MQQPLRSTIIKIIHDKSTHMCKLHPFRCLQRNHFTSLTRTISAKNLDPPLQDRFQKKMMIPIIVIAFTGSDLTKTTQFRRD